MKKLIQIFLNQLRSKEIWMRMWDLNRFHRFENYGEWKKNSLRRLTIEDAPAIFVSTLLAIALIVILNLLFQGRTFRYALLGCIAFIIAISRLVDLTKKQ